MERKCLKPITKRRYEQISIKVHPSLFSEESVWSNA